MNPECFFNDNAARVYALCPVSHYCGFLARFQNALPILSVIAKSGYRLEALEYLSGI
jgi:hypothetical protein